MKYYWIAGLKLTVITLVLFGITYPLMITGIARLTGPDDGGGEKIYADGKLVGFRLIGQKFDRDEYFNSRPSAVDYNAAATGGSNKGPSNPEYLKTVQARIDTFVVHNPGISKERIPTDLVTASGGGLDPHISPEAARVQIARISKVRHLDAAVVGALVDKHTEGPAMGFGPARINVLEINLALDQLK